MGKSLLELFQTQKLSNGQTAAQKYEVQDSKENTPSNASGFMNAIVFPLQQIARRNLSNRTGETLIEEEVTGLRVLNTLASPQLYGTDIIRLTTQKSNLTETMLQSANSDIGGPEPNNGIIGGFINKAKTEGLTILSKIGIALPQTLIPTALVNNSDFNTGQGNGGEDQTMETLAKIKKDGAGSLAGKFLAQNAKGTPKQIFNQALGGGIDFLKNEVKKKLIGAPTEAAQNLAVNDYPFYNSLNTYTDTVSPWLENDQISLRNDLSSILIKKQENDATTKNISVDVNKLAKSADISTTPLTTINNPYATPADKVKAAFPKIKSKLSTGNSAQQILSSNANAQFNAGIDADTTYEDIVDWNGTDIDTVNDLSTLYKNVFDPKAGKQTKAKYYSASGAGSSLSGSKAIDVVRGITTNKGDYINSTGVLDGSVDTTKLDAYDFIPLRFASLSTGESATFRGTITGLNETFSPTWDSNKFIGSPFPYYTYSQIERSVTFNFRVYSQNGAEHKKAWDKLNFLSNLTYPQNYLTAANAVVPPFIRLTLGDMYKSKIGFIESLSYSVDDNTPWEIGLNGGDTSKYKLPMIVDVAITVKFIQSKASTYGVSLYGFTKAENDKTLPSSKQLK